MIGYYNSQGDAWGPTGKFIGPAYAYTADISGELYKYKHHRIRAGVNYTRQDLTYAGSNTLRFNLAYAYQLSKQRQITTGLNINAIRHFADISPPWAPGFIYGYASTWNAGCGLAYHSSRNNFYLGASVTYLRSAMLNFGNSVYHGYQPYFIMQSGIDIKPGKNLVIRPEAILSYRTICSVNGSLTLEYKNRFSIGAIYNTDDQCGPKVGYKTKRFEFNYAWVGYFSRYVEVYSGTHNVSVRFQ